jgi:heterogeneous nuclear ribonucleoprotein A1/A3
MAQPPENGVEEPGKMFVGGLSWTTTAETLKAYFSQYGEVDDSVVMYDRQTMRSRGYGYVTLKDPEAVQRVLSTRPHIVDGKQIDPKQCCARGTERMIKQCKVFLGGLPLDADEQAIRSFFAQFGKVIEAQVMYDVDKKRSRGFGFVAFDQEAPVNQLIAQRYVDFNGKQVEIRRLESSAARRRAQGPGGPGGYGYGPGGPGAYGPAGGYGAGGYGQGYGGPMGPQGGPGPMGAPYGMYGQQQQWGYGPQYGPAAGKWAAPAQMQAYTTQWNGQQYGQMAAGPAQGAPAAQTQQGMRAYGGAAAAAPASNPQWGFSAATPQYGAAYQQAAGATGGWQVNAGAAGQQRKGYEYDVNSQ